MKKTLILCFVFIFGFALFIGCGQSEKEKAKTAEATSKVTYVTIGTGGITGVYYPTGGAIAKMINNNPGHRRIHRRFGF